MQSFDTWYSDKKACRPLHRIHSQHKPPKTIQPPILHIGILDSLRNRSRDQIKSRELARITWRRAQLCLHYALNIDSDPFKQKVSVSACVANSPATLRNGGSGAQFGDCNKDARSWPRSTHVRWLYNLTRVANAAAAFDGFFFGVPSTRATVKQACLSSCCIVRGGPSSKVFSDRFPERSWK